MFTSLAGKLLISMPSISDGLFEHSLIFLCAHSEQGAMGIIVNKPAPLMFFADLLDKIKLTRPLDELPADIIRAPVRLGGPVDQFRGFVLHTDDYKQEDSTLIISEGFGLTSTTDILMAMAEGRGPHRGFAALGYAGWSPGQLENEIQHNGWLHCDAAHELIFSDVLEAKHDQALKTLGVDPRMLSGDVGHA